MHNGGRRFVSLSVRWFFLMLRTHRSKTSSVVLHSLAILVAVTFVTAGAVHAQSGESSEDAALVAAERALLEGLSAKGQSAFEPESTGASAQEAQLKPATYQAPIIKQEQVNGAVNRPVVEEVVAKGVAQQSRPERHESVPAPAAPAVAPNPNPALKRELEASQRRVTELEHQLEEVRGQLTMAETELSRLATISEARNRASLGRPALPSTGRAPAAPAVAPVAVAAKTRIEVPHIEPTPASSADLTIATVEVEKAELRLGPGKNHSPLMTVAKGSRLAVEARQGEWLRVFAPNGQRAWVQSRLVTFGSQASSRPTSTAVRIHGYSSSLEDEAFRRVQSLTARR
ncbi:MAG: Bacterial domain [Pseudomonadota bacterium]